MKIFSCGSTLCGTALCRTALRGTALIAVLTLGIGSGFADDTYLSKSEFEQFLQEYQYHHQPKPAGTAGTSWSKGKFTITPYGYINLDASYETDKTTTGDFTVYANPGRAKSDPGFNIDPKSTRLGLKIDGAGLPGWRGSKTEGVIEFDFQGGGAASRNRAALLLRKAYVAVSDKHTRFLAGQDWEVISPLYPKTLNYTAGACVGNNGYRRGMLRADHKFESCSGNDLTLQFALADNVYRDGAAVSPSSARYPIIEGRAAYSFGKGCLSSGKPIVIGVSSHIGEERFTFAAPSTAGTKYLKTWSFNTDFDFPLTKRLTFQMEYFLGENLSNVEGGVLQGVDWYRGNTIRSQGGWAALTMQWTKKLQTNAAFMIDDPFNDDVVTGPNAGGNSRTYSHCWFVNAMYNWNEALMTGFEVDFWRTHWQKATPAGVVTPLEAGTPVRFQFTVRYTF